jgi:hypothetical protein
MISEVTTTSIAVGQQIASGRTAFINAILRELLVEGIAVNAKARSGLDLNTVTCLKDLLNQLSLDLADDPVVKIIGGSTSSTDALTD